MRHGLRKHPLYKTWVEMRYRCDNPKKHNYSYYGGRGIKVCDRWRSFQFFLEDMGPRPEGATLDRIDVNGDYEPSNCRWASKLEQANNARSNRKLVVNGEVIGLCQAAEKYGVLAGTIWFRLESGWNDQDAATMPAWSRPRRTESATKRAEAKGYS
jgi:hypothetical protein